MQSGFWTPEHLQLIVKQVLTLLVMLGLVPQVSSEQLATSLGAMIGAVFVFAINGQAVVEFFRHQAALKGGTPDEPPAAPPLP